MNKAEFDSVGPLAGLPGVTAANHNPEAVLHRAEPSGREVILLARQEAIRLGGEHVH